MALLSVLVIVWIAMLLLVFPALALLDIASDRSRWGPRRILSAMLIAPLWPIGPVAYGLFLSRRRSLRLGAAALLGTGLLLLGVGERNRRREEAKESASVEKYRSAARTERLALTAAFGAHGPPGDDDYVQDISLSADGSRMAVSVGRTLRLWDVHRARPLVTLEELPANDILAGALYGRWLGRGDEVALSPDGTTLAAYRGSVSLRLWAGLLPLVRDLADGRGSGVIDVWSGSDSRVLRAHRLNVSSIAFLPDGRRVLTGSYDGTLALFDLSTGDNLFRIEAHPGWVQDVALSPRGDLALSGASPPQGDRDLTSARLLTLWDVATGSRKLDLIGHADEVHAVSFAADGARAVSASYDGTFRVWDAASGREVLRIDGGREVYRVAFSPDGRYAVSGGGDAPPVGSERGQPPRPNSARRG